MTHLCCTVCKRAYDHTQVNAAPWVTINDVHGDPMYACSTACGMRLGYSIAVLENATTAQPVRPLPSMRLQLALN